MKKRLLSILLALCMVLALLPFGTAFAEEFEPDPAVSLEVEPAEDLEAGPGENIEAGAEEAGVMPLAADITPPVVTGVYMNSPGGTVVVGDTLYFDIEVEDESDITSARLEFRIKGADDNSNTINARFVSYDADTKIAKASVEITDAVPNATWVLSLVHITDFYGNSALYYLPFSPGNIDFDSCTFTIMETSDDNTAPVVTSVSMDSPDAVVTVGDTLYFNISVEDESDIISARLEFRIKSADDNSNTINARFVSYDATTKTVKASIDITNTIPSTTWVLSLVHITDFYGNSALYYLPSFPGNIDFDSCTFTVIKTSDDITAPIVAGVSMDSPNTVVTVGDTLYFNISVEDESDITSARLEFRIKGADDNSNTINARFVSYDATTKTVKASIEITNTIPSTTWVLGLVHITDFYGNSALYYLPSSPGNIDFDSIAFTVASNDILPDSVYIPASIEVSVRSVYTILPDVTPAEAIPNWTWASADTSIATVTSAGGGISCNVTGVAPGTTTITGTTKLQDGTTASVSCQVTVEDAPLPESGTIEESYQIDVGSYININPVLTPSNATTLYEITSDNPHVAGIATTGGYTGVRIIGNNPGTATITIRGANDLIMTTTVRVGKETDIQHEKMTVEGYPATCVWPGRTDGVVCSACWYVFSGCQEIPATGKHTWSAWQVVQAATSTTAGSRERYCVNCGERETQAIPATGSSTPSRPGTSGGSGGGSGGSSGSLSSPSSPGNVTSDGQNVQASVKDGTAEITNSDKNISDILDGAENGAIHIDASANKDVTEVSIPKGVVDAVTENETVSAVSITTSAGTVELHEEALNTISNAMTGSNDTISLEVKTIDADTIPSTQKYPIADVLNSAVFINLSATIQHRDASGRTTSTETIHEFGGSVTVSVPFEMPANMAGRQIIACHIADDGSITYFSVKYENGVATFTTTHFSLFALVESRAAAFADINVSAWYMPSVEYVLNRGLMGDAGNQRFDPNGTTTRGMIMTILARLDGVDTSGGSLWYQKGMEWAVQAGVSDGTNPGGNITREQLAVMLWRYADEPTVTGSLTSYSDAGIVHDWADTAMVWAVQNGIITGSDGKLNPRGNATRVQAAAMLTRFCQNIEK